jgi:hypothetical protein
LTGFFELVAGPRKWRVLTLLPPPLAITFGHKKTANFCKNTVFSELVAVREG